MRTYKYKTLRGFLANCAPACGYVRASLLFGKSRIYVAGRGFISFDLSAEARAEAADILAGYLYATKGARRAEVAGGLREGLAIWISSRVFILTMRGGVRCGVLTL